MSVFLLFVLLQLVRSEDLIQFIDNYNITFKRIEDDECYYTGNGKNHTSEKYDFNDEEVEYKKYKNEDCSGDPIETTKTSLKTFLNLKNQKYIECPEYVGFTIKDVSEKKDCKYEESAERIYYKPGCYQTGGLSSIQYSVVDNHLIKRTFTSKGCTGVDTLYDFGECDKCNSKQLWFVQCGSISMMILLVVALILFF